MSSTQLGTHCQLMQPEQALAYLQIEHPLCQARLYLQGAQITHFQPRGQDPLLWLSDSSQLATGKAIRGGIPICWPWFGRTQPDYPAHGFARTREWHLDSYHENKEGVLVELHLNYSPQNNGDWPYPCRAQLKLHFGHRLSLELTSDNTGNMPMPLSLAFHSYFRCQQLTQLRVEGLAGCPSVEQGQRYPALDTELGTGFGIEPGMDRVFFAHQGELSIRGLTQGTLSLRSQGLPSVILWNPGPETAACMADLSGDGSDFFCAENGLAMDDELLLAPGEQHHCRLVIGID